MPWDKDTRAGYCYIIGQGVSAICEDNETSPDQLKADPLNANNSVDEPILDLIGFLMSIQGFLLEEDDDRAGYLIHRVLEAVGPVVYEALGVSPAMLKPEEVLH